MHTLAPGILQKMISKVIFGLKKMAWGSGMLLQEVNDVADDVVVSPGLSPPPLRA